MSDPLLLSPWLQGNTRGNFGECFFFTVGGEGGNDAEPWVHLGIILCLLVRLIVPVAVQHPLCAEFWLPTKLFPFCKMLIFISIYQFPFKNKVKQKRQKIFPIFLPITDEMFASQTRCFFLSVFPLYHLSLFFFWDKTLKNKVYAQFWFPQNDSCCIHISGKINNTSLPPRWGCCRPRPLSLCLIASVSGHGHGCWYCLLGLLHARCPASWRSCLSMSRASQTNAPSPAWVKTR